MSLDTSGMRCQLFSRVTADHVVIEGPWFSIREEVINPGVEIQ
jgi:hypothetical protein